METFFTDRPVVVEDGAHPGELVLRSHRPVDNPAPTLHPAIYKYNVNFAVPFKWAILIDYPAPTLHPAI